MFRFYHSPLPRPHGYFGWEMALPVCWAALMDAKIEFLQETVGGGQILVKIANCEGWGEIFMFYWRPGRGGGRERK